MHSDACCDSQQVFHKSFHSWFLMNFFRTFSRILKVCVKYVYCLDYLSRVCLNVQIYTETYICLQQHGVQKTENYAMYESLII